MTKRCSASRDVSHAGLLRQALKSLLHGSGVVEGAVEAGAVVEADLVPREAFPILQRPWSDAVPELLLDTVPTHHSS